MYGVKNFFASRTIWAGLLVFVLSILTYFKVGILGLTPEQMEELLLPATGIVGGALTVIFRWLATKQVKVVPEVGVGDDDERLHSVGGLLGFLLLASCFLLPLSGCSLFVTPAPVTQQDLAIRQVTQAQAAYLVAVTTVNTLHAQGKISSEVMKTIVPLEQTVYAYLQAAQQAAEEGRTVDSATQLKLFSDALQRFIQATVPAQPVPVPSSP